MKFGIPVNETEGQSGPIFNLAFWQIPRSSALEPEKLEQALHAMKEAGIGVPVNLDPLWSDLETVRLIRSHWGNRFDFSGDDSKDDAARSRPSKPQVVQLESPFFQTSN